MLSVFKQPHQFIDIVVSVVLQLNRFGGFFAVVFDIIAGIHPSHR